MKEFTPSRELRRSLKTLCTPDPARSIRSYVSTWAQIAGAIAIDVFIGSPIVTIVVVAFIGARMHSLYALNHEASHGSLFRGRDRNKWTATVLSNFPFFHHPEAWSFVQWKRVHRLHHRYLMTERDPNFVERVMSGEADAPYGNAFVWKQMALAGPKALRNFFVGRQDYVYPDGVRCVKHRDNHLALLLLPIRDDLEMERERRAKWVAFAAILFAVHAAGVWAEFALYWLLPMYTTYPAVLRMMDLTEHRWFDRTGTVRGGAVSTAPGVLGSLFASNLNRSYHREHHFYASVPWYRLPALSEQLIAEGALDSPHRGFFGG